jgi:hypothetical protein
VSCTIVSVGVIRVPKVRQTYASILRRAAYHLVSSHFAAHAWQRIDSVQASSEGFSSVEHSADSHACAVFAVKG